MTFVFSGGWIYLVPFLPVHTRETIFVTSCLHSCKSSLFWKRVCIKRKALAPRGSKFFPFRVDPFSEEGVCAGGEGGGVGWRAEAKQLWQICLYRNYQFLRNAILFPVSLDSSIYFLNSFNAQHMTRALMPLANTDGPNRSALPCRVIRLFSVLLYLLQYPMIL